jgi:hypothetical protein
MKILSSKQSFERDKEKKDEPWLYITRNTQDTDINMEFEMTDAPPQKVKTRVDAGVLPGKTAKSTGYIRAKIDQFGKTLELVIEENYTYMTKKKVENEEKEVEEKIEKTQRIPLEFVSKGGTFDDWKNGKTVELQITKKGLAEILEKAKAQAQSSIKLKTQGKGAKGSVSSSAKFLSRSKGTIIANLERIDYEAPPMSSHGEGYFKNRGFGMPFPSLPH